MTKQSWRPGHEAGSALILAVIEAARTIAARPAVDLANLVGAQVELVTAVRMLDGAVKQLLPRPAWCEGTWVDVARLGEGTRVRLGGHEAVVFSAALQAWHVDPRSSEYRPQPLEHQVVAVRLGEGQKLYRFPPSGPVEILDVEWPEEDLGSWVAAAGAVLEAQALYDLKHKMGAVEL